MRQFGCIEVALSDALVQLDPTCDVTVADPLITQGPAVVRNLAALYSPVIRRSPRAWACIRRWPTVRWRT